MATKLKKLDDCTSGLDYKQYLEEHGVEPHKNGSYWSVDGYGVNLPNSNRTLPKETRQSINAVLLKIMAVVTAAAAVGWFLLR